MRWWLLSLVVASVGALVACGAGAGSGDGGAAASCIGPRLTVSPAVVHAGGTVEASGQWFAADCYDTGQPGSPPPLKSLTVQLSQSGKTWDVRSDVDATGDHYSFRIPITLPKDLRQGSAEIRVKDHGASAVLRVQN